MRCPYRTHLTSIALLGSSILMGACDDSGQVAVPDRDGAVKSTATVRAARRAYDGAPPTIPHVLFGMGCSACHNARGLAVPDVGFAPASPHAGTAAVGETARCRQCHVLRTTDDVFVKSEFVGLAQGLQSGARATTGAPPTIPHRRLMRENCLACHDGAGAREEIRTSHPERMRCRQCHVPVTTRSEFAGALP